MLSGTAYNTRKAPMRTPKPSAARLAQRRAVVLKKLGRLGPFLRGSLCSVSRGNATTWQLTVSVRGKTHTVYVPVDMAGEVRTWIQNHRQLQRLLTEISKLSMALIHRHVPEKRRAAGQPPRPRAPRRANSSIKSGATSSRT